MKNPIVLMTEDQLTPDQYNSAQALKKLLKEQNYSPIDRIAAYSAVISNLIMNPNKKVTECIPTMQAQVEMFRTILTQTVFDKPGMIEKQFPWAF